jgi:hypothetical protein
MYLDTRNCYTKAANIIPMDRPHFHRAVTLSLQAYVLAYVPFQSYSCSVHTNVCKQATSVLGLLTDQRRLEGITIVDKETEDLSAVMPVIHELGFSTSVQIVPRRRLCLQKLTALQVNDLQDLV